MIWHPHTDEPGTAENALIATNRGTLDGEFFLSGMAANHNGQWYSEIFEDPITPPFWWMDERELISTIPGSKT